jgi:hypothetical protein
MPHVEYPMEALYRIYEERGLKIEWMQPIMSTYEASVKQDIIRELVQNEGLSVTVDEAMGGASCALPVAAQRSDASVWTDSSSSLSPTSQRRALIFSEWTERSSKSYDGPQKRTSMRRRQCRCCSCSCVGLVCGAGVNWQTFKLTNLLPLERLYPAGAGSHREPLAIAEGADESMYDDMFEQNVGLPYNVTHDHHAFVDTNASGAVRWALRHEHGCGESHVRGRLSGCQRTCTWRFCARATTSCPSMCRPRCAY